MNRLNTTAFMRCYSVQMDDDINPLNIPVVCVCVYHLINIKEFCILMSYID